VVGKILRGEVTPPGQLVEGLPPALDAVVLRGLALAPEERYASAREMAAELERSVGIASQSIVGEWVASLAGAVLADRDALVAGIESASLDEPARPPETPTRIDTPSAPRIAATPVPTSQPTIFAAQAPAAAPPRRSLGPLALLGALALLAAALLWSRRPDPAVPSSHASAPVEPHASAPVEPHASAPVEPLASAALAAPPALHASAAPLASALPVAPLATTPGSAPGPLTPGALASARSPSLPVRPGGPLVPGKMPTKKADCNPPYRVDAEGIRHMKPECF
jgi:serine/threonine-protein kinase